ncbi:hypothetical protein V6N13_137254 [Hibiscus sabdariffa]
MDSEDEEWLMKFNNELFPGNGHCEHLFSEGCFELIVDAFEKEAYLRSLDDNSNEEVAAAHRLDLAINSTDLVAEALASSALAMALCSAAKAAYLRDAQVLTTLRQASTNPLPEQLVF